MLISLSFKSRVWLLLEHCIAGIASDVGFKFIFYPAKDSLAVLYEIGLTERLKLVLWDQDFLASSKFDKNFF